MTSHPTAFPLPSSFLLQRKRREKGKGEKGKLPDIEERGERGKGKKESGR